MSTNGKRPTTDGPRIIHPQEHAAIQSPTTPTPAHAESGPSCDAEGAPTPPGEGGGTKKAAGVGDSFVYAQAERDELKRAWAMEVETRVSDREELTRLRNLLEAERAQHAAFLRAFKFPADAHPLIAALMERMVRVMGMEAAGGACNPHAVVCAALDAAHTFAAEDGTPATEKLRDIVRVSAWEVDRMKAREEDANTYHAEWMHQRDLADALADQIATKAAKRARKRAEKHVRRMGMTRARDLLGVDEGADDADDIDHF